MVSKRNNKTQMCLVTTDEQYNQQNSLQQHTSNDTSTKRINGNSGRTSSSSSSEHFCMDESAGTSSASSASTNNNNLVVAVNEHGQLVCANYFTQVPVLSRTRPCWARLKYQPTIESLHDEIIDLYNWLKPTAEEIWSRRLLFNRTSDIIKGIWPDSNVQMFGSVATNSFLPSSDIDICVRTINSIQIPEDLHKVADVLKGFHFENIHVLDKTAFPLVKCTDQLTQLNIDINFNINGRIDRTVGWIRDKLDFMPHLEPLLLVLKLFLAQRGLNNPYTGGLPSYALVVMLVHYLEYIRLKNKSDVSHKDSYNYMTLIGRKPLGLLLHYFFFYFYCFDYSELGIKVRNRVSASLVLHKKELIEELGEEIFYSSPVFICDPCERGNNLGRSAHNILTIRQAFYDAFRTIGTTFNHCNQLSPYIKNLYCGPLLKLLISDELLSGRKRNIYRLRELLFGSCHGHQNSILSLDSNKEDIVETTKHEEKKEKQD
uniref:Poly(A) RNA polymerase mitochondrial-like central palm domain-containing protein n=1 Tax=Meloidogyne enterolobii TaxID=390850 RepID=A0A6V7VWA7_MELEN|nr:unnamed protein product [Meloidogyne enterolobii]